MLTRIYVKALYGKSKFLSIFHHLILYHWLRVESTFNYFSYLYTIPSISSFSLSLFLRNSLSFTPLHLPPSLFFLSVYRSLTLIRAISISLSIYLTFSVPLFFIPSVAILSIYFIFFFIHLLLLLHLLFPVASIFRSRIA